MEIPRREERRLVEVRRIFLQVGARVRDRGVRSAEALHRVRNARADLEEAFLPAEGRLYVPFDSHMVFGVVRLFRVDGGLYVRREIFPPGAGKSIQLRRKEVEIITVRGVGPGPGAGCVVSSL